jgi:A/G-specific adenine glycosylase
MRFSHTLTLWYNENLRDLPWRKTNDPYKIWLSEVILQQTRVAQGMPYYLKFIKNYPNVTALARASEQEVLRDWQGLGYYSRARNLQKAAKQVVDQHQGEFPTTYAEIIKLKGIGPYTAAAIASIAFNEAHAVVDGNVYRVLARLFGIKEATDTGKGRAVFQEKADSLLDKKQAGTHNQALMELGATVCTPKQPRCASCPFQGECYAYNHHEIALLPVKVGKVKVRERYLNYVLFFDEKGVYLQKRQAGDIWQGLFTPWLLEGTQLLETTAILAEITQVFKIETPQLQVLNISTDYRHLLTHQRLFARFWLVQIFHNLQENDLIFVGRETLDLYPVPRLISAYYKSIAQWLD